MQTELKYRRDLRKETIFTIDPTTARDLDDALHVKDMGNDVYEVSECNEADQTVTVGKSSVSDVILMRMTARYVI